MNVCNEMFVSTYISSSRTFKERDVSFSRLTLFIESFIREYFIGVKHPRDDRCYRTVGSYYTVVPHGIPAHHHCQVKIE